MTKTQFFCVQKFSIFVKFSKSANFFVSFILYKCSQIGRLKVEIEDGREAPEAQFFYSKSDKTGPQNTQNLNIGLYLYSGSSRVRPILVPFSPQLLWYRLQHAKVILPLASGLAIISVCDTKELLEYLKGVFAKNERGLG